MNLYESIKGNLNKKNSIKESIEQKYEKSNPDYNSFLRDVKYYTGSYDYLFGGKVSSEYNGYPITVNYFYYNRPYVGGGYNLVTNVLSPKDTFIGEGIQEAIDNAFEDNSQNKLSNNEIKTKILEVLSSLDESEKLKEAEKNESEDNTLDKVRDIANELMQYFEKNSIYAELIDYSYDDGNGFISYEIEWGDWKHDHIYSEYLVKEFFNGSGNVAIDDEVTEEDGSDTYSAIHNVGFNLDSYLKLNEAANPANEEKNKIIRQALRGPKNYEKNKEALEKMGIKGGSGYETGETIYLRGPNGRQISVDPDGTNVWHTGGSSEKHYKKELDFKNRHSSNYNNMEHLDFNSDKAKVFDYYNYLHKPQNEYQDEVDDANERKEWRDNEDKTGYNLPDSALTPEEKSLNKRPRKYVQLKKDKEAIEEELKYNDLYKKLDDIDKEMKNLHK